MKKKTVTVPCIAHSLYNCVSALAGWFNRNECEIISKYESAIAVGDTVYFRITSGISNPFLLTKLSVLVFHIFMITRCGSLWLMSDVAIACDDFQVAVLMNQDEYEKHRNYELSAVKCLFFNLLC